MGEELDYKVLGFWLSVAQWVAMALGSVWVYLRTRDSDNAEAIKAVNEALGDQGTRLARLEEQAKHAPTNEEIGHLTAEVAGLKSQVNGVAALLSRIEHQTDLIHQHLLSNK